MVSSDDNFSNLRKTLSKCKPPCIPYIGTFLTDLTFIEQGHKDFVEGKVNFVKFRMIANILQQVKSFQSAPYPNENPKLEEICGVFERFHAEQTTKDFLIKSRELEPN